jgi:hypothetical protein
LHSNPTLSTFRKGGAKVEPKLSQSGAKVEPRWSQGGAKVEPKLSQSGAKCIYCIFICFYFYLFVFVFLHLGVFSLAVVLAFLYAWMSM